VNTKTALLILTLFVAVSLTAGCLQPKGEIGFTGDMNVTNGTFTMDGEIVDGSAPNPTYENVTCICTRRMGNSSLRGGLGRLTGVQSCS